MFKSSGTSILEDAVAFGLIKLLQGNISAIHNEEVVGSACCKTLFKILCTYRHKCKIKKDSKNNEASNSILHLNLPAYSNNLVVNELLREKVRIGTKNKSYT